MRWCRFYLLPVVQRGEARRVPIPDGTSLVIITDKIVKNLNLQGEEEATLRYPNQVQTLKQSSRETIARVLPLPARC